MSFSSSSVNYRPRSLHYYSPPTLFSSLFSFFFSPPTPACRSLSPSFPLPPSPFPPLPLTILRNHSSSSTSTFFYCYYYTPPLFYLFYFILYALSLALSLIPGLGPLERSHIASFNLSLLSLSLSLFPSLSLSISLSFLPPFLPPFARPPFLRGRKKKHCCILCVPCLSSAHQPLDCCNLSI
ncbi:hypothetical protein B0F90DRAFT_1401805 [Multifurca ochricompacta]|uniref:Uncharacterized protein n=1 Tax=Multifurca ochricompacta TaxID=376703 RepID=A0AAD4QGF4_9AGAM|nr:hypothetical protein B0F90DRAFT_1401805 [Multifurca ochricompacta]